MLPAILDMLIALAGLAIGLFVSKLWESERHRTLARAVGIGLVVLFVAGVVWKGTWAILASVAEDRIDKALLNQVVSGDILLRAIPKECPTGVDAKEWES